MVREYNKRLKKEEKNEGSSSVAAATPAVKEEDNTSATKELPNDFKVPKDKDLKLLQTHADLKLVKYDPDGDGFNFGIIEAFKIHKRTLFFNFIRKSLFNNQAKGFTEGAEALVKAHAELEVKNVCDSWEVPKQDLALLMAIGDKGVGYLRQIKYHGDDYGLSGIKMNKKKLLKRAEWTCQIYRDYFMSLKSESVRR